MGISPQGNYPPQGQKYPQKHHHGKGTGNSSGPGGAYPQPGYA